MSCCRVLKSRVEKGWRGLKILAPQSDTHKIRDHSMIKRNPAGGRHSPPNWMEKAQYIDVENLGQHGGHIGRPSGELPRDSRES